MEPVRQTETNLPPSSSIRMQAPWNGHVMAGVSTGAPLSPDAYAGAASNRIRLQAAGAKAKAASTRPCPRSLTFSQPGRILDPATFLLCAFATVLADLVAGAAGGASVDIYAARLALGDRAAHVSIDGDVRVTASDVGSDNAAFAISRMVLNGWSNRTQTLRCSN